MLDHPGNKKYKQLCKALFKCTIAHILFTVGLHLIKQLSLENDKDK